MNRKSKAKILLGTFIVSGILSQMSTISPLHAMVTDDDTTAATPSAATASALVPDEFPLHTAAFNGDLDALKHAISTIPIHFRSSRINAKDSDGNTVLHCAIYSKNVELIKWLCENYDFDITIKNNKGFTPLALMNRFEQAFIIELARNHPKLAEAQSLESTSASVDNLTDDQSSESTSAPKKIKVSSPFIVIKLNGWQRMKDMMIRLAEIRKLVKQGDFDAIVPLVNKDVLNAVVEGYSSTLITLRSFSAPLKKKLFEMGVLTTPDDLLAALQTAAYRDDLDLFKQVIEKVPAAQRVAMLNKKTVMHNRNILHSALVQPNDAKVARYILENYDGVDLNDEDSFGDTPASSALKNHHPELIDLIAIKGGLCTTRLHQAACKDDIYTFIQILSTIQDRHQISMLNTQTREEKDTVLHTALKRHNLTVAMYIIEYYAIDLNKQDKDGNTLLDIAIKKDFLSIVALLRTRGAIANTTLPKNIPSCDIRTLSLREFDIYIDIFRCVDRGDLEGLRHILSTLSVVGQIKLLKATGDFKKTILHQAAEKSFEIVKYILDNYDVDINAKDGLGQTALEIAINYGNIKIANLLRERGATCSAESVATLNNMTQYVLQVLQAIF